MVSYARRWRVVYLDAGYSAVSSGQLMIPHALPLQLAPSDDEYRGREESTQYNQTQNERTNPRHDRRAVVDGFDRRPIHDSCATHN